MSVTREHVHIVGNSPGVNYLFIKIVIGFNKKRKNFLIKIMDNESSLHVIGRDLFISLLTSSSFKGEKHEKYLFSFSLLLKFIFLLSSSTTLSLIIYIYIYIYIFSWHVS